VATAFAGIFYSFVTLLAMVNPIEAAGAFASLTVDRSAEERSRIAMRATLVAAFILLAFGFIGDALLAALGISIQAFEIAGGLLLLRVGFNMVFAQQTDTEAADRAKTHAQPTNDPSVFPLAIPIISGPGALTAIVAIFGKSHSDPWLSYAAILLVTVAVFALTYIAMLGSGLLSRFLGRTGIEAISRVVGIVVAAIAVQLIINGVGELTRGVIR
jgi:multiple antibiotic resistance protein